MSTGDRSEARLPLAERLRPTKISELIGNSTARSELRQWAENWQRSPGAPRFRAALLSGPPGVGKTSAALALARDMEWTVVEMNASDARNENAIEQVAGRASLTHTLGDSGVYRDAKHGGRTLILLDEADCLTGRRGDETRPRPAPVAFRDFLRTRYETVEALADAWGLGKPGAPKAFRAWSDLPQSPGRAAWARLAPAEPGHRRLAGRRTAERSDGSRGHGGYCPSRPGQSSTDRAHGERREPFDSILPHLSERGASNPLLSGWGGRGGGLARAHNSLRTDLDRARHSRTHRATGAGGSTGGAQRPRCGVAASRRCSPSALFGDRNQTADFYEITDEVLSSPRFYRSVEIQDRLDATPDDLFPWIEENLPRFAPTGVRRAEGFEVLAAADLCLTRARRFRVWSLWSYASELMTGGVGTVINDRIEPPGRPVAFPQFLGQMGRSRASRLTRRSIMQRVGRAYHVSREKGIENFLPILDQVFAPAPYGRPAERWIPTRRALIEELKLTPEEVGWLMDREPDSGEVASLFAPSIPASPTTAKSGSGAEDRSTRVGEENSSRSPEKASKGTQRSLVDF